MAHFDKIRDNLKVNNLDEESRKDLFNKFVKAGGQVIREKSKKPIKIDREKQRDLQKRLDTHHSNLKNQPQTHFSGSFQKTTDISRRPDSSKGFHLLIIRFRLFFQGVSNFGGSYFKNKFLYKFKTEYNPAFLDLQMLYLDLFKQNPAIGLQIIQQLDKLRPLYYEIIEMAGDIYDMPVTSQLIDNYAALPNAKYHIYDYKTPLITYFKKLYILNSYVDLIYFSFEKAIDFQMRMEKGKPSIYAQKRKRIQNSLYIIFNKLFPKLYWLLCLIHGEIFNLSDNQEIETLLNIKTHMKPGTRLPNQMPVRLTEKQNQSSLKNEPSGDLVTEDDTEIIIPPDVKKGLLLMDSIDYSILRNDYIKDDFLRNISETDKVMTTFLIFHEFDKEYSFVLTTYKIKFTQSYSVRGKSDYRDKLSDLYNLMRPCFDSLKEYFISFEIYEKSRIDRPTSNEQYYLYTKRLTEIEKDKKNKGRTARLIVQKYMQKIIDEMMILIVDMEVNHEIIQNPQDLLEFDSELDSNRKLNNKKIFYAIEAVYSFASAFNYRLTIGDLSGDATEQGTVTPATNKSNLDQSSSTTETLPKESKEVEPKGKSSILGELDDYL
jgi:hypothetical protein